MFFAFRQCILVRGGLLPQAARTKAQYAAGGRLWFQDRPMLPFRRNLPFLCNFCGPSCEQNKFECKDHYWPCCRLVACYTWFILFKVVQGLKHRSSFVDQKRHLGTRDKNWWKAGKVSTFSGAFLMLYSQAVLSVLQTMGWSEPPFKSDHILKASFKHCDVCFFQEFVPICFCLSLYSCTFYNIETTLTSKTHLWTSETSAAQGMSDSSRRLREQRCCYQCGLGWSRLLVWKQNHTTYQPNLEPQFLGNCCHLAFIFWYPNFWAIPISADHVDVLLHVFVSLLYDVIWPTPLFAYSACSVFKPGEVLLRF